MVAMYSCAYPTARDSCSLGRAQRATGGWSKEPFTDYLLMARLAMLIHINSDLAQYA